MIDRLAIETTTDNLHYLLDSAIPECTKVSAK